MAALLYTNTSSLVAILRLVLTSSSASLSCIYCWWPFIRLVLDQDLWNMLKCHNKLMTVTKLHAPMQNGVNVTIKTLTSQYHHFSQTCNKQNKRPEEALKAGSLPSLVPQSVTILLSVFQSSVASLLNNSTLVANASQFRILMLTHCTTQASYICYIKCIITTKGWLFAMLLRLKTDVSLLTSYDYKLSLGQGSLTVHPYIVPIHTVSSGVQFV